VSAAVLVGSRCWPAYLSRLAPSSDAHARSYSPDWAAARLMPRADVNCATRASICRFLGRQ